MSDNEELKFELFASGDFVRILPIAYLYPNADLDWDKNWIQSQIEINALPFHGKYKASLMTIDFEMLKQELTRIYDDLSGSTMFSSLEHFIEIKIKGDGIGHFVATCAAQDTASFPVNKLSFELHFDQTQIPGLIAHLDKITKTFPIIGNEFRVQNR